MQLRKSILAVVALSAISTAALAHDIGVSIEPGHYTIYAGQEVNVHCVYGIHVRNVSDHAISYHIVYGLIATGYRFGSQAAEDIRLEPGQSYDKPGTDLHMSVKYDMHNTTAELEGVINVTPENEPMQQWRAKNYINVY